MIPLILLDQGQKKKDTKKEFMWQKIKINVITKWKTQKKRREKSSRKCFDLPCCFCVQVPFIHVKPSKLLLLDVLFMVHIIPTWSLYWILVYLIFYPFSSLQTYNYVGYYPEGYYIISCIYKDICPITLVILRHAIAGNAT